MCGTTDISNGVCRKIVDAVAHFDALLSLAQYARTNERQMCLPHVLNPVSRCDPSKVTYKVAYVQADDGVQPQLNVRDGVQPCLVPLLGANELIANDISLGAEGPLVILLTGPNMGGKSTLMRQAALLAVLAQAVRHCHYCAQIIVENVLLTAGKLCTRASNAVDAYRSYIHTNRCARPPAGRAVNIHGGAARDARRFSTRHASLTAAR